MVVPLNKLRSTAFTTYIYKRKETQKKVLIFYTYIHANVKNKWKQNHSNSLNILVI